MRTFPGCYDCLFKEAVNTVESSGADLETQINTLKEVLNALAHLDDTLSPSAIAGSTNQIMRDSLGIEDFYKNEKESNHQLAYSYLDDLRELARNGNDPLEQGLKISASGNIIDILHTEDYFLWDEVTTTVSKKLIGGGIPAFREMMDQSPHLLILADNVGETVFDRVLIENLEIPVKYAVKGGPILNDATLEDALAAGIDKVAEVVVTGAQSPGTILDQCTEEFQDLFVNSPLVLSKGQANYETMDEMGDKVFFLLRVKCPILAEQIDAPVDSLVMKQGKPLPP
jgi:uncharacterized protein with ATP-grasp and redox domains